MDRSQHSTADVRTAAANLMVANAIQRDDDIVLLRPETAIESR